MNRAPTLGQSKNRDFKYGYPAPLKRYFRRQAVWGDGRLTLGIREVAAAPPSGRTRSPAVEVVRHIKACPDIHPQGRMPCASPRRSLCPVRRNIEASQKYLPAQYRCWIRVPNPQHIANMPAVRNANPP